MAFVQLTENRQGPTMHGTGRIDDPIRSELNVSAVTTQLR